MSVPWANTMPSEASYSGSSTTVVRVSGPRTTTDTSPPARVMTSSQFELVIESIRAWLRPSERHTRSTCTESEGRSTTFKGSPPTPPR